MKFNFSVPISGVRARLAIKSSSELSGKDFVLVVKFPGISASEALAKEYGLSFSANLNALFVYNPAQHADTTAVTGEFTIPEGVTQFEVVVQPWNRNANAEVMEFITLRVRAPWDEMNSLTMMGVGEYRASGE